MDPKILESLGINPVFLAGRSPDVIRRYLLNYRKTLAFALHPDICSGEDSTAILSAANAFLDEVKHATPEDLERLVEDAANQRSSTDIYEGLYVNAMAKVERLNSEVKRLRRKRSGGYAVSPEAMAEIERLREKVGCLT